MTRGTGWATLLIAGVLVSAGIMQCSDDDDGVNGANGADNSVYNYIAANDSLATLEAALLSANLDTTLQGTGPFTIFAPSDAAFDNLPAGTLNALLATPESTLTDILLYHVVAGDLTSTQLSDTSSVSTVQGSTVSIDTSGDTLTLNGSAAVVSADNDAGNGTVHIIDEVLLPTGITLP